MYVTSNRIAPFLIATVASLPVSGSRDSLVEKEVMTIAFIPFAWATAALVIALVSAVPAFAEERSCAEVASLRSSDAAMASTIEVTNSRPTPSTIELVNRSGTVADYFALAPGESRRIQTYRTHAWISRDARLRCLSGFVSEEQSEKWQIAAHPDGDYERRNVRSFPVYVAPEFGGRQALLERILEVLDTGAGRIGEAMPSTAWRRVSTIPIWLEAEPDSSYVGRYIPNFPKWPASHNISIAMAGSIQFTSSLAAMTGRELKVLMHELAHAYHHLVLSEDEPQIREAFQRARASGRYNAVRHSSGGLERAYAMDSPLEFFAELSVAYFFTNDSFPFTRDDLKAFDPESYRVISNAWERPFEEASRPLVPREIWRLIAPR
jgi:hypothetical protein